MARNTVFDSIIELETREWCNPSCTTYPCLWLITWDPTQPVATRPLTIQKDGTWYTYGWDLTKNICEIFGQNGYIRSSYAYTPFGAVTTNGDINQPVQWSSEYYDNELSLIYYNYRHYNPMDGRWINRDPIAEQGGRNLYGFAENRIYWHERLGLFGFNLISGIIGGLLDITTQVISNAIEKKPLFEIDFKSVFVSTITATIIPGAGFIKTLTKLGKVAYKSYKASQNVSRLLLASGITIPTKITSAEIQRIITYNNANILYFMYERSYTYTIKFTSWHVMDKTLGKLGISKEYYNLEDCEYTYYYRELMIYIIQNENEKYVPKIIYPEG